MVSVKYNNKGKKLPCPDVRQLKCLPQTLTLNLCNNLRNLQFRFPLLAWSPTTHNSSKDQPKRFRYKRHTPNSKQEINLWE